MLYDIIIVGGGLVGSSLALGLRESGLKVALIDARLPSSQDGRLFALNAASCQLLEHLTLWSQLKKSAAPIEQVHVSNQGQFGSVRLTAEEVNMSHLGYVVPAYLIESAFQEAFQAFPKEVIFRPAYFKELKPHSDHVSVTIEQDGTELVLQSKLVIGADGAASSVRQQLGIVADEVDYQQLAIVTRTKLKRAHKNIAYERFNREGAIAMLPLPGNECATIWTADTALAKALLQLTDNDFLQHLQKAFGYRLGRLQGVSKRFHYPLKLTRAKTNIAGRVALLGNAAHAMHPIAAQGFNLALYEVAALIELIEARLQQGKKLDDTLFVSLDERVSQHQNTTVDVSHRLAGLFSKASRIPSTALTLGMVGFDVVKPVKRQFIHKVMGSAGRLPRLLLSD